MLTLSFLPRFSFFYTGSLSKHLPYPSALRGGVVIRHPGQVPLSGTRAGIKNVLIFRLFPGYRVSPKIVGLALNDRFVEWRHIL